jgi:hypothetical protein
MRTQRVLASATASAFTSCENRTWGTPLENKSTKVEQQLGIPDMRAWEYQEPRRLRDFPLRRGAKLHAPQRARGTRGLPRLVHRVPAPLYPAMAMALPPTHSYYRKIGGGAQGIGVADCPAVNWRPCGWAKTAKTLLITHGGEWAGNIRAGIVYYNRNPFSNKYGQNVCSNEGQVATLQPGTTMVLNYCDAPALKPQLAYWRETAKPQDAVIKDIEEVRKTTQMNDSQGKVIPWNVSY